MKIGEYLQNSSWQTTEYIQLGWEHRAQWLWIESVRIRKQWTSKTRWSGAQFAKYIGRMNARLCSVMMKWALLPWNQSNGNANLLMVNEIESNERDTITVWDGANVCAAWCTANSSNSSSYIHTSPEAHTHSAWTLSKYTHADNLSYSKLIFRTIRFDSISIANWNRIECAVHTWRLDFNFEPATLLAMEYWPLRHCVIAQANGLQRICLSAAHRNHCLWLHFRSILYMKAKRCQRNSSSLTVQC